MQVQERLITEAIVEMLESNLSIRFDVLRPPVDPDTGETVDAPYGIIIPRPKGTFKGPPYSKVPWGDVDIEYRVKSVGLRYDQCQWLADRVRGAFLDLEQDGSYVCEIVVHNHAIMERRPGQDSPGGAVAAGNMVEVDDSFIIAVTVS